MKILIPVSDVEHSKRAITYFFQNRAFFDLKADVVLMHVCHDLPRLARATLSAEAIEENRRAEVDRSLDWPRERFRQSRVPFGELIDTGEPAARIVKQAVDGKFDLIVMGSHVDEPTRRLVRGSVTFEVLSSCKVPVLVVR